MTQPGWIYVLANPAMPGLVKIGLSTRDPDTRMAELGRATGVPQDFVLIYRSHFENCREAESFVHTLLEKGGYRPNKNREFFNAPIPEAIDAVVHAQQSLRRGDFSHSGAESLVEPGEKLLTGDPFLDGLDDPDFHDVDPVVSAILEQAEAAFLGTGDHLQDKEEAFQLYLKAAKLRSGAAHFRLGNMLEMGDGCPKDLKRALDHFKQASQLGKPAAFAQMARIFERTESYSNAGKCWDRYFRTTTIPLGGPARRQVVQNAVEFIRWAHQYREDDEDLDALSPVREELVNYFENEATDVSAPLAKREWAVELQHYDEDFVPDTDEDDEEFEDEEQPKRRWWF